MNKLKTVAKLEELDNLFDFIAVQLDNNGCAIKTWHRIAIAAEEIFTNIVHYSYTPKEGEVEIYCTFSDKPKTVSICFIDSGIPYNPLDQADPDTSLLAEDRKIGGLGIYMVKKYMDQVIYEYIDGKNNLTITVQP